MSALNIYNTIKLDRQNNIWVLEITRPEALNALSADVLEEIGAVQKEIRRTDLKTCRALIITGAGLKAFVAGADIKEIQKISDYKEAQGFSERGQNIFREFEKLFVPVIAAVNGFALGGGFELALACDMIVASEKAVFGLPEVGLGLIPGYGGTIRLARVVGLNRAREIIFTGQNYSADEAFKMNLVSKVVAPDQVLVESQKLAQKMIEKGPLAIAMAKKSILKVYDQDGDSFLRNEAKNFSELFKYNDTREGLAAFLEKRKPNFQAQ